MNAKTKFIGRERELARIDNEFAQPEQRNILIYGRRRIGKSELIKQALSRAPQITSIYYECRQTSEADNVQSLTELASNLLGFPPLALGSVREFLDFLFTQAREQNIILVLDEYPYLRDAVKGLDSIIQAAIDEHRSDSQLKIVLCGSYVSVMKALIDASNPLYGRIDLALSLNPMDYYDSARFYPDFSVEDKVRLYSVFGGVPYYNQLINQNSSVYDNIIELVTTPGARLENEAPLYISSEIAKITNANEVFGALSQGYSRWKDVLAQSHVSSSSAMADVLLKLEEMGLVEKRAPINDPQNKRKSAYRIADPLTLFYYRYIFRFLSQRQVLDSNAFFNRFVAGEFEEQYVPRMFEEICRQYLVRQNKLGAIEPPFDVIGRFWYNDPVQHTSGEFDVVTHDPNGYVFYEAKFRSTPLTQHMIDDEIKQVEKTGLACYAYGFFSRSGFEAQANETLRLITLDEMYA